MGLAWFAEKTIKPLRANGKIPPILMLLSLGEAKQGLYIMALWQ